MVLRRSCKWVVGPVEVGVKDGCGWDRDKDGCGWDRDKDRCGWDRDKDGCGVCMALLSGAKG